VNNGGIKMDKVLLKFFADVLYIKGKLCAEELEDIMEVQTFSDLDDIVEKMLCGKYNVYKRGETYDRPKRINGDTGDIIDNYSASEGTEICTPVCDGAVYIK
jgi:hypothetical protein